MKKRFLSLTLALVMSFALVVPGFAAVVPLEVEAAGAADAAEPRYVVYQMGYTLDLQNNTYADLMFSMRDIDGKPCFVGVDAISFRTTNPNGSHWKIVNYDYIINESMFILDVEAMDEEGDKLSSNFPVSLNRSVLPWQVVGRSLTAEAGSGVVEALEPTFSASWRMDGSVMMVQVLPTNDT